VSHLHGHSHPPATAPTLPYPPHPLLLTTRVRGTSMSPPSPPVFQGLERLDRPSSEFNSQLSNILVGQEYKQCVPNLQGEDLVWLVDYLDKVCRPIFLSPLPLKQRRLSIVLILPVQDSRNVSASSEVYVAPGRYSQHRTHFRIPI
jgi:hypothetical protein